jgi:hypothetical protein
LPPGFGAARWPNVHRDSPVRVEHAPARGTSAGRPANAGYARPMTSSRPTPSARPLPSARPVPSARPMPYSRPGGRGVPVVSLPGERIARLGDRPA